MDTTLFKNKRILITGGTGSIGRAVLERLAFEDVDEIIIFSRDEMNQEQMRQEYSSKPFIKKLKFVLGDIRFYSSIVRTFENVDFVFHAAAMKIVPSCESFPMEAVRTNIQGTDNVLKACKESGVKKVVILSTDKAVYPVSTMGMTKAIAERVLLSHAEKAKTNGTIYSCVRLGNVIGTRGSVVPLFLEQILKGKSITITDPNMTRFMLTQEVAVNLILRAFNDAKQGEIFLPKTKSCKVGDLAFVLQEIVNRKTTVKIIGKRPGEKKSELLACEEELPRLVLVDDYYRICNNNCNQDREYNFREYPLSHFSSDENIMSPEELFYLLKHSLNF